MGITGNIGRWLIKFLTNRTQQVLVNGKLGPISHVKSGVPQGTILGPSASGYPWEENSHQSCGKVSFYTNFSRSKLLKVTK